jgi:acyl-CoA reductase-like NAD-dependent aldehyde dehydrogenase
MVTPRGAAFSLSDPATGENRAPLPTASPEDVQRAVSAAHEAQSAWAQTPARTRGAILFRAADELDRRREELARQITLEMGKVLAESSGEVDEAIFFLRFMAGEGARLAGETRPVSDPRRLAVAERTPVGVVGVITPWNFLLAIPVWKIATALVADNAIAFKPALQTTGTGAALAQALCAAGVPAGVLNLVAGPGPGTGEALARHPGVQVLTFTGSTAVGRNLAGRVGARGGRIALELGGKNVVVVLADADLEQVAEQISLAAFATSGQRWTAASRVIAQTPIYDDLVALLADRAAALTVGPGEDPASDLGPLVSRESRDRVAAAVSEAIADGGRLLAGGAVPPDLPAGGGYLRPTVIAELDPSHALLRDELFGPVTAVVQARDEKRCAWPTRRSSGSRRRSSPASSDERSRSGAASKPGWCSLTRQPSRHTCLSAASSRAATDPETRGSRRLTPMPNGSPSTSPRLDARLLEPGRQVHDEPTERQWRTA